MPGCAIGLTVTGPHQPETLRRALEVTVDGKPLFDCVQATWNVLEQSAGTGALAEAHAAGLGVIVKEALANGRLTELNDDPAFAAKHKMCRGGDPTRSQPRCLGPGSRFGTALGRCRSERRGERAATALQLGRGRNCVGSPA